ncbi:MAG TPA: hypothetical protein PK213_00505 [Deltaproteobacteria bacterium]|nr:hypothetical protein [Deltaproteobacteria bacterium]
MISNILPVYFPVEGELRALKPPCTVHPLADGLPIRGMGIYPMNNDNRVERLHLNTWDLLFFFSGTLPGKQYLFLYIHKLLY